MSGEGAMKHSTRKRIYDHIVKNPGITFTMLRSVLDLNDGTLSYHLDYLRRTEMIDIRMRKNQRCYLPREDVGHKHGPLDRDQSRVLKMLSRTPRMTRDEIAETAGIKGEQLSRALSGLRRRKLVKAYREGRDVTYSPIDEDEIIDRMMMVLIERYVKGDITFERLMDLKERLEEMSES
jgi:predicted transcriptional regulator